MDAKELVADLRGALNDQKEKGVDLVPTENLIKYLDAVAGDPDFGLPSEIVLERLKAELQKWVEDNKNAQAFATAHSIEMFRSVIQAGQNALRTAFVMNGGASVALLAFIGHLAGVAPERIPALAQSLGTFVCGVLVAALTAGLTYISQWFYAGEQPWKKKTGLGLNIAAIVSGLAAYIVFAVGTWRAYVVFARFGQ